MAVSCALKAPSTAAQFRRQQEGQHCRPVGVAAPHRRRTSLAVAAAAQQQSSAQQDNSLQTVMPLRGAVTAFVAAGAASLLLLGSGAPPAAAAGGRQPPIKEDAGRCELAALDKFADTRATFSLEASGGNMTEANVDVRG